MSFFCWIGFHNWSKWKMMERKIYHILAKQSGYEDYQTRCCLKCGLAQERIL